jgi:hypothetical protein
VLAFAPSASAITVSSTGDSGGCTLREAITAVNAGNHNGPCGPLAASGATPINLPANTYTLTQGQLQVAAGANLAIIGANPNGPALTTIDAGGTGRVLEVAAGANASLTAVRVTGGRTANGAMGSTSGSFGQPSGDGGGILNRGQMTLDHVIITGNRTGTGGRGADGNGSLSGSQRNGGSGNHSGSGGGIYNATNAGIYIVSSTISGNGTGTGGDGGNGGIGWPGIGNFASGAPGGTGAYSGSGGGILNFGSAVIVGTTVSGNFTGRGGDGGQGGNGTGHNPGPVVGNGGDGGYGGNGGWNYNPNSGFYNYQATLGGGGIYNFGSLTLTSSTLSGNNTGAGGHGGGAGLGGQRDNGTYETGGRAGYGGSGGLGGALLNIAGLNSGGAATLTNVTVSGNFTGDGANGGAGSQSASLGGGAGGHGGYGGGIWGVGAYYTGAMNLTHVTVSKNFVGGGGLGGAPGNPSPGGTPSPGPHGERGKGAGMTTGSRYNPSAGAAGVVLKNSIISSNGNPAFGDLNCYEGTAPNYDDLKDAGNNLLYPADASCPGTPGDPQLGLLQDNGGLTETMLPASGSAAIAAIAPGSCVGPADQRGFDRPGAGKTNCDIGAVETGPPPGVTPTATALSSSANPSIAGQPVTFTATISPQPSGGPTTFTDNGTPIPGCESVALAPGGQATCTVTYPFSLTHTIAASYAGNSLFAASSSNQLVQEVRPSPTPGGGGVTPTPPPGPTGKRAAALRKCKKIKKNAKARANCIKKAKKQPV